MHDDERIIECATVDFLDKDLLNAFLTERRISRPQFAQMNDTQAMEMLSITRNGVPTMRRAMQEAGLPAPVFINRQNEFVVVLYNH